MTQFQDPYRAYFENANEACSRIIGCPTGAVTGQEFRQYLVHEDLEKIPRDFQAWFEENGGFGEFDLRVKHRNGAARTLQDLYPRIHDILRELMPAENNYIALYEPGSSVVSFPYHSDTMEPVPPPRKDGKGLTGYVLHTDQSFPVSAGDLATVSALGYAEQGKRASDWLGVPLKSGNRTIGVLTVQKYEEEMIATLERVIGAELSTENEGSKPSAGIPDQEMEECAGQA